MRWTSRRTIAWLALGLLVLLGVQLAEASFHTHSVLDECAPCRVLSLCRAFEVPAAVAWTPAIVSVPHVLTTGAVEGGDVQAPACGRAPPTV